MDGVVVIPAVRVDNVLEKAEDIGRVEDKVVDEIRNGAEAGDVFKKCGRL
jgi:4-hydroxy-4-methyl-2-oxoglutarate aldolase